MSRIRGALHDPRRSVVIPLYRARTAIEETVGRVLAAALHIELTVGDRPTVAKRATRTPGATGSSCAGCC
jgi:hypothetical protein